KIQAIMDLITIVAYMWNGLGGQGRMDDEIPLKCINGSPDLRPGISQSTNRISDIDDDDAKHDEMLMDAILDLLPAFAKVMGSHFAPIFAALFVPLMKFA
ncbi:hypothetical protein M8C21_030145, partial [Ambrosia artemisiifolia]